MMERELVTITLLLLSVTFSSSLDPMITTKGNNIEETSTTNGPLSVTSRDNTINDKVTEEIKTLTAKLPTFHGITNGSEVTPEQETRSTNETSIEASTSITKEPSSATFGPRPVIDLVSSSTDLPVTSHEVKNTVRQESTTSHPNYKTVGTSKPTDIKKVTNPYATTTKAKPDVKPAILIAVSMVILILILIAVIVVMVRNKRRSGSQSFHSQSRSSKRENVWAGQVPDLGDGKITERPVGTENGAAGNKPEKEQEMITFISNEKKDDSVEEVKEMNNGDALEEQKPLLEDSPEEKEETTPAPNVEQELV